MSESGTLRTRLDTQEIPRGRWIPFLAEFTRDNRGAHARLDIVGPEVGARVETEDRPFDGIAADVKDGEHTVWITFGSTAADHIAHGVRSATAIRFLPPSGAAGAVLEIEARDGTRTVLQLTSPERYGLPPAPTQNRGK